MNNPLCLLSGRICFSILSRHRFNLFDFEERNLDPANWIESIINYIGLNRWWKIHSSLCFWWWNRFITIIFFPLLTITTVEFFFEEHPIWSVLQILIFSFFSSETKFFYKNRKLEKKNVSGFIALTCSTSKIYENVHIFILIHIQLLFIDKSMFTICTEVFVFTIFSFLPIFAK